MGPVAAIVLSYLIGSIPVAVLVARRKAIDPRTAGDGNAGWWNTRALVGKRLGAVVLVGDTLKGMAAVGLAHVLWGDAWATAYIAAGAAMVGHAFPVFARFRGGKAILTFVGAVLIINTPATLIAIGIGTLAGLARKRFSVGGRTAMAAYPFVQAAFDPLTHVAATGVLMTFIGLRFLLSHSPDPSTSAPAEASFR